MASCSTTYIKYLPHTYALVSFLSLSRKMAFRQTELVNVHVDGILLTTTTALGVFRRSEFIYASHFRTCIGEMFSRMKSTDAV